MGKTSIIKGGTLFLDGELVKGDILIEDDKIASVITCGDVVIPDGTEIIDASGCIVSYGFADLHVHFREPGFSAKETIRTGSLAAARGGYTTVCTMPNLDPVPDCPENLAVEQALIERDACIRVLPYSSITIGRKGLELVDFDAIKGSCAAFSDDGSGVQDDSVMLAAMEKAAQSGFIIAAHCEDNKLLRGGYIHDGRYCRKHGHKGICSESEWGQIERDLELCARTGCRYHVCHISTRESVELIRKAKAAGVRVTCETGPHYLALCEDDLQEDGRFKMNPPLRSADDREALIEGLADGTIDAIATDHAPHTAEEKSRGLQGSAMGITGLETAFPVVYTTLVKTGRIKLERVLDALCCTPRRIFGLGGELKAGESADITIIDTGAVYRIDSSTFASMGHSTPFDGMEVQGRIIKTLYKGKEIL